MFYVHLNHHLNLVSPRNQLRRLERSPKASSRHGRKVARRENLKITTFSKNRSNFCHHHSIYFWFDLISLTFSSVVIFYQVWQVCWFLAQTENFYQRRMLNFVLTSLNPKLLFGRDLFTQLGLFSLIFVKLLSEEEKCLLTFVWVIFYDRLLLFNLGGNYLECFCEKPPPPWTASLSPVTNTVDKKFLPKYYFCMRQNIFGTL